MNAKTSELPPTEAPIVLVYKSDTSDLDVDSPDIVLISPDETMETARNISIEQWEQYKKSSVFRTLFDIVFGGSIDLEKEPDIQHAGSGAMHIVGMLIMLAHAENLGKRPLLRYPETSLNPRIQPRLADLVTYLSKHPINNFKTDAQLCAEKAEQLGVKVADRAPLLPYHFRCIKCLNIHHKSGYCIAQQASGHEVEFTCPDCKARFLVPHEGEGEVED